MRIQVLQNFGGGITNERRILPGVYDAADERLCGAAAVAFMLETRAAVVIEEAVSAAAPPPTATRAERPAPTKARAK